ncbi:MAG: alkylation repair enzyme [Mucilaginibacter sp.]|nr:alkylation repair enzyme [Mucilaginibacter sp.]
MEPIQAEITQQLLQGFETDKPAKFKDLKKYIGTQYDFVGLSVPAQRAIFKAGFGFNERSLEQQLNTWDRLWKTSRQYEIMNFALMFVSKHLTAFEPYFIWNIVKDWVQQVDNWAHSDGLSAIYAHLLEKEPHAVYTQYKLWNTSVNPWERRQSIVGLLYYSKLRKINMPFEKLLAMMSTLLTDENYFVQKGVGWTLREMGNIYPAETLAFLNARNAAIHPIAFTAAIEKLDAATKDELKQLRKAGKTKLRSLG